MYDFMLRPTAFREMSHVRGLLWLHLFLILPKVQQLITDRGARQSFLLLLWQQL